MHTVILSSAAVAALAGSALGAPVNSFRDTLSVPFTAGSGNSNTNFSISRDAATGVELGIKAKERWFGDGNVGGAGATYIVERGFSPTSGAPGAPKDIPRGWWNFDLSIVLGAGTFSNTSVFLDITNNINSMSVSVNVSSLLVGAGLGFLGAFQDSQNLGFATIAPLVGYDALQTGTYTFTLRASEGATGGNLGQTSMLVQVVPTPLAAGMGGAGLLAIASRRRRRR